MSSKENITHKIERRNQNRIPKTQKTLQPGDHGASAASQCPLSGSRTSPAWTTPGALERRPLRDLGPRSTYRNLPFDSHVRIRRDPTPRGRTGLPDALVSLLSKFEIRSRHVRALQRLSLGGCGPGGPGRSAASERARTGTGVG